MRFVIAVSLLLSCIACGMKGPPLPPETAPNPDEARVRPTPTPKPTPKPKK